MAETPSGRPRSIDQDDFSEDPNEPSHKKARIFVARQACERCRLKKTRCDEDFPCSLCKSLGLECKYGDRKATRNEASFSTVLSFLRRIETKVDQIPTKPIYTNETLPGPDAITSPGYTGPITPRGLVTAIEGGGHSASRSTDLQKQARRFSAYTHLQAAASSPSALGASPAETVSDAPSHPPQSTPISFSAHKVILWPPIAALLPQEVATICLDHGVNYVSTLEGNRPNIPLPISFDRRGVDYTPIPTRGVPEDENPLARLSVSVITALCDSFFATFHLAHPILDRRVFSHHTLSIAIQRGFDYEVESCIVLMVMALGCWGIRALREAGFARSASAGDATRYSDDPAIERFLGHSGRDGIPGLVFFNEARKRLGFLKNDNSMQNCQFHLLTGLYYAQLVRPSDWYACVGRAATCCLTFWEGVSEESDEWVRDMQSRLFWITVMAESVLADELSLPTSRLAQSQDKVPLPKFVKLERHPFLPVVDSYQDYGSNSYGRRADGHENSSNNNGNNHNEADDLFYNYHFLSQIAHRILLTRMKDSLYYSSPTGNYPPTTVEDELHHQHQQWRTQLPPMLHFRAEDAVPPSAMPRDILVVAWLRSRFVVAKIHMARPYLHKVLSRPDLRTSADIKKCHDIFLDFLQWGEVVKVLLMMKNCLPLRFSVAAQIFGQLLIVYAFKNNDDPQLATALPRGYQEWCTFVVALLEEMAPLSPAMARDAQIAAILRPKLVESGTPPSSRPLPHH